MSGEPLATWNHLKHLLIAVFLFYFLPWEVTMWRISLTFSTSKQIQRVFLFSPLPPLLRSLRNAKTKFGFKGLQILWFHLRHSQCHWSFFHHSPLQLSPKPFGHLLCPWSALDACRIIESGCWIAPISTSYQRKTSKRCSNLVGGQGPLLLGCVSPRRLKPSWFMNQNGSPNRSWGHPPNRSDHFPLTWPWLWEEGELHASLMGGKVKVNLFGL